ncbi:unnamed protein product [Eruca vesicaria subsp. sativa]|uniref:Uncharacterized protein n=1 Tax=Eruca vesicaria subsp. sativa TaxID=29727 RepID=A0ABC8KYE0_ERUVS|nr:unnamed protein product [Eruca vesicaria subsp. sativa]
MLLQKQPPRLPWRSECDPSLHGDLSSLHGDEIDPAMIWEQRVKDVEAEKERRIITSPGFSFSAAGLLFP